MVTEACKHYCLQAFLMEIIQEVVRKFCNRNPETYN